MKDQETVPFVIPVFLCHPRGGGDPAQIGRPGLDSLLQGNDEGSVAMHEKTTIRISRRARRSLDLDRCIERCEFFLQDTACRGDEAAQTRLKRGTLAEEEHALEEL